MKETVFIFLLIISYITYSQNISETFFTTRVNNAQSNETLKKRHFEYNIEHRFGDIAGTNGGADKGFGFDNAADIRFGLLYGLNDKLSLGFGRSKGSYSAYKSVLDGSIKYKLIEQKQNKSPISISLYLSSTYSYVGKSKDTNDFHFYPKSIYRFAYCSQLIISRKFSTRLSIAIHPTLIHRNYVRPNDQNTIFALGSAISFKLSKNMGLLIDYFHAFRKSNPSNIFQDAISGGFEYMTNGHRFCVFITNASLFNETQYVCSTTERWDLGQFRLGFSISRTFKF